MEAPYLPNQETIADECRMIQATWDDAERWQRFAGLAGKCSVPRLPYTVPEVETTSLERNPRDPDLH